MRKKLLSLLALLSLTVASAWAKTVIITSDDLYWAGGHSYTIDGVTLSVTEKLEPSYIEGYPITISTSEGNFTQIVISADEIYIDGSGWSGSTKKSTWTGNASSVSFNGLIKYDITIKCTIETPLSISPNTMQTFLVDESVRFTANTGKTVKWSVGGTNASAIALYSDTGCTVSVGTGTTSTKTVYAKGVSVGSATVTVTTSDGTQTASCDVTVKGPKWNGGTLTAIDDQSLGAITVTDDATLTINEGVTVIVNDGINVTSGTLTVNGLGTLVVIGANGTNGSGNDNIPAGDGCAAISGNIIVQGATVTAIGGQGGRGTTQDYAGYLGGPGGAAFSGSVTIYSGTITANGGKGGQGGAAQNSGKTSGDGGNGGAAFSSTSTLTYYGGNVTAIGGAGGNSGDASSGASSGSVGNPGNAFASNSVTLENTPATLTGDGSDITIEANPSVTGYRAVSISGVAAIYFVTANQADGAYWSTFYSNEANYQASEGTQVFAVNLTGGAIEMTEISDRIVVSGQGVVLKNSTTGSITMTRTNATPAGDFSGNSLTGTMSSITNPGNAYVLNKGSNGVGFYKLSSGGSIGVNKAYLTYDGSNGVRAFFLFEEETTGIAGLKDQKNSKDVIYNIAGQRIQKMQKGINIVNGKKVIINQ